jgi:hypothetical protein
MMDGNTTRPPRGQLSTAPFLLRAEKTNFVIQGKKRNQSFLPKTHRLFYCHRQFGL